MCLWDMDTWMEESLDARDILAALEGKIFRHSPYFYDEKVIYTRPLVGRRDALPERYDDLAVAWEKLGDVDEAIAVMEEKEDRFPGQYTTYANHGTFLAHRGDLADALVMLERAVVINPDAHFGREHLQIGAIRRFQEAADHPSLLEERDLLGLDLARVRSDMRSGPPRVDLETLGLSEDTPEGLVGMIRFGSYDGHEAREAHVWFSLGLTLYYEDYPRHAVHALRRAERYGHPLALAHGHLLAEYHPGLDRYDILAAEHDDLFAQGQGEVAAQRAQEDQRLRSGERAEVFGY